MSSQSNSTAVPAATVGYSRAALNLVNRNLRQEMQKDDDEPPLLIQYHRNARDPPARRGDPTNLPRTPSDFSEWYFRVAGMLDDFHPGYVFSVSEQNHYFRQLLDQPIDKITGLDHPLNRVMPTCHKCGTMLFPGTKYSQCRLGPIIKKKRKRQPKNKGKKQQPDGLAEHPDLEVPELKDAKNKTILSCRICGARCAIPALDRNDKEAHLKPVVSQPVKEKVMTESADFLPLSLSAPAASKPLRQEQRASTPLLQQKKKKKKKAKNSSQLHDFLSTLND